MNYYLNKLPKELFDYIITLSYKPQPAELLTDIVNYTETKEKIKKKYFQSHQAFLGETEEESMEWIVNDLVRYMNRSLPTILGYSEKMEDILLRANLISIPEDIDLYFYVLFKKPVSTQVNILLGLLIPSERSELLIIT
jgi:hypothetical protein